MPRRGRILGTHSGGEIDPWGEILVWEPPAWLVIAWQPNRDRPAPTEIEVTFESEGSGTNVTLEHRGWERLGDAAGEARASYDSGWPKTMALYAASANT